MSQEHDKSNVSSIVAQLITALPGYTPLDGPIASDQEQRFALAMMYKEKGFRDYMRKTILSKVGDYQNVQGERGLYTQQGRVMAFKELFALSKQMYEEALKIDKKFEQTKQGTYPS